MGQEEPTAALYDFLYRDSNRIASYYAQLFQGRLTSVEKSDSTRSSSDSSGKLNLSVVGGEVKSAEEVSTGSKQVVDPHDVLTTDVLSHLLAEERIRRDPKEAPHGSLILENGTLVFVDRHILELGSVALDMAITDEESKPRKQRNETGIKFLKTLKSFMATVPLPSAFLLQTSDGSRVAGTIKDDGMVEPITTYYFKHGTAGLSDVFLIGIKEVPSTALTLPGSDLMGVGQQVAQALSDLLLPKEAIRVTPVVMFRKL